MAAELQPDLIVMDWSMPEMNGLEAAAEILKSTPKLPILLFTFHKESHLDTEARKVGVRKVVAKTDGWTLLSGAIQELLADEPNQVGPLGAPENISLAPSTHPVGPLNGDAVAPAASQLPEPTAAPVEAVAAAAAADSSRAVQANLEAVRPVQAAPALDAPILDAPAEQLPPSVTPLTEPEAS